MVVDEERQNERAWPGENGDGPVGDSRRQRHEIGTSLVELTVAMGMGIVLSAGFLVAVNGAGKLYQFEHRLTFYSSEAREVIHQVARDIRSAGSNPLSKPFLFDGDPADDRPLVLDPGGDGDMTNDLEVRYDRFGGAERNEPDGDADDDREAIRYRFDANTHRIVRQVRFGDQWDQEVILINVCDFAFSFYDRDRQPTVSANDVSWVRIDATTTTAPSDCYQTDEITRKWALTIKLRNR